LFFDNLGPTTARPVMTCWLPGRSRSRGTSPRASGGGGPWHSPIPVRAAAEEGRLPDLASTRLPSQAR